MATFLRIASYSLLGVALFVAVVTARLMADGRRHFQAAMHLSDAGDRRGAVASLEDAAKAYVPGSPYVDRALRELAIMARAAEMRGDLALAATIWEVTRRSILATRHVVQPNEGPLLEAEKSLQRLVREEHPGAPLRANPIVRPEDPSPAASLLLFAGLALWIAGALLLCLAPRRTDGALLIPRRFLWAGCLGGLCLWLLVAWLV